MQHEIDSGIGDLEMFHMVLGMLAHLLDTGLPVRAVRQCRIDLLGGVLIAGGVVDAASHDRKEYLLRAVTSQIGCIHNHRRPQDFTS